MKLLLVIAVLFGLIPEFGEAVEQIVHFSVEGSFGHSNGEDGADREHGCSPTDHHCGCCTNLPVIAALHRPALIRAQHEQRQVATPRSAPASGHDRRLFRPPIRS